MKPDERYMPQDPERYKNVMSQIWHQPNSDNYWISFHVGSDPTICLINVGMLLDYFIDYDPQESLIELQKILNDFSTLVTKPEHITDDWTQDQIYKELVNPVNLANKLHECIETGCLTQLYDKEMRGMPAPAWEGKQY